MNALKRWFFGAKRPDYRIGAAVFCRGIGLVYLIAILSWWLQVDLLVGQNGLVPIGETLDFLDRAWEAAGEGSRWNLPTLFWLTGASDAVIHAYCAAGCLLALLAIAGIAQGPSLAGLWLIYLSLVLTGDPFMNFQWDILLLEAGFLSLLVSAWRWREPLLRPPPITPRRRLALYLVWFAAAKLIFLSGWVKLAWATDAHPEWWPDHTAMLYHYQTQPIPTWTAWFMHQLPAWFHQFSVWPMYLIELVLPFLVFLGYRLRAVAGAGFILLMILILLTGNYTYFNLLTIVMSLPLFADRLWTRSGEGETSAATDGDRPRLATRWVALGVASPALLLVAFLNLHVVLTDLHRAPRPLLRHDLTPAWADAWAAKLAPFRLCSGYGLFRTMTTERPEILLQGSTDGVTWRTYDIRWKPARPEERPRFVAPHQPRVAWQLWFAALERRFHPRSRNAHWIQAMVLKLLQGDDTVQALFVENPFPEGPPRFLRARLHRFEFTDWTEWRASGRWWRQEPIGDYLPVIQLR